MAHQVAQSLDQDFWDEPALANRNIETGHLRKQSLEGKTSPSSWCPSVTHLPLVKMDKKYNRESLNDVIHTGPKLQTELFDVLLRFRQVQSDWRAMMTYDSRLKRRIRFPGLYGEIMTQIASQMSTNSRKFSAIGLPPRKHSMLPKKTVGVSNIRIHSQQKLSTKDPIARVEDGTTAGTLRAKLQELWGKASMEARKWVNG